MPANGRRDLIRRLKVTWHAIKETHKNDTEYAHVATVTHITTQNRFFEELRVVQLLNRFSAFYRTRGFITVLSKARQMPSS
jgi:hypothetical protein